MMFGTFSSFSLLNWFHFSRNFRSFSREVLRKPVWHEILRLPTNWHGKFNHPFDQFSDPPLPKINMSHKKGTISKGK